MRHVGCRTWGWLYVELRKRNTAASLSEGFAGSHHKGAKTSQCVASFLCCFLVMRAFACQVPWQPMCHGQVVIQDCRLRLYTSFVRHSVILSPTCLMRYPLGQAAPDCPNGCLGRFLCIRHQGLRGSNSYIRISSSSCC